MFIGAIQNYPPQSSKISFALEISSKGTL